MAGIGNAAILVMGIVQLIAGFQGIEYHFGIWVAVLALIGAAIFRFMLPMTIGSFFGATDVWGWHWAAAFMIILPDLLFMVPVVMAFIIKTVRTRMSR